MNAVANIKKKKKRRKKNKRTVIQTYKINKPRQPEAATPTNSSFPSSPPFSTETEPARVGVGTGADRAAGHGDARRLHLQCVY